jgi:hypothetical protein
VASVTASVSDLPTEFGPPSWADDIKGQPNIKDKIAFFDNSRTFLLLQTTGWCEELSGILSSLMNWYIGDKLLRRDGFPQGRLAQHKRKSDAPMGSEQAMPPIDGNKYELVGSRSRSSNASKLGIRIFSPETRQIRRAGRGPRTGYPSPASESVT